MATYLAAYVVQHTMTTLWMGRIRSGYAVDTYLGGYSPTLKSFLSSGISHKTIEVLDDTIPILRV